MKDLWARYRAHIVAVFAAVAALVSVVVVISDDNHDGVPDHITVTITKKTTTTAALGGPGQATVPLTPPAQATAKGQAEKAAAGDDEVHSDLRSVPPAARSATVLEHNADLKPAGQPDIPATLPLAAAHTTGCRTTLVRNFSSRNGQPVLLGVVHYTVSTDNGWSGVLGNVKWFDTAAAQASSNYIIDRVIGACALAVPESQKAWTQAGFNGVSVSVEVTARGNEGELVVGKGRARLVALLRGWHARWGIPYRHGKVSGCKVILTGFVQHTDLGACGGGHFDTTPYSIDPYIAQAKALDAAAAKPVTKPTAGTAADRVLCRKINWWRKDRPRGLALRNANLRVAELKKHGLVCTTSGMVAA